jgi:TetR/AcrR family transcriptional regulator, repressor for neighboring sulfatase
MKKAGVRKRREPEAARALILEAGQRVLGEKGPERATLRDVASEAGVSHALITHYFKTYEGLVEAIFECVIAEVWKLALAAQDLGAQRPTPAQTLRAILSFMTQPIHQRLATWAFLRDGGRSFHASRAEWLRQQTGMLQALLDLPKGKESDGLVLFCIASLYGYSVGGHGIGSGLGLTPPVADNAFLGILEGTIFREAKRLRKLR